MKLVCPLGRVALALATLHFTALFATAQHTNPPSARPSQQQVRSQWDALTPEQRQAKTRELQSQHPKTNDWASGSWPAELRDLTPEQRQAKVKELREKYIAGQTVAQPDVNIAAQRQAKLKAKLAELKKKQADGKLTPDEQQQLTRLEAAVQKFGQPVPAPILDSKPGATKPAEAK